MLMTKEGKYIYFKKPDTDRQVRYDLQTNVMESQKNQYSEWVEVEQQYVFFKGITLENIQFSDNKFKEFFRLILRIYPKVRSVSTILIKLEEHKVLEEYISLGLKIQTYTASDGYYKRQNNYAFSKKISLD